MSASGAPVSAGLARRGSRARTGEPRSLQFRRERESEWSELEELVERALRRGLGAVRTFEIGRLLVLYRSVLSSLAVARNIALDRELVRYLESLATRAYLVVYASRRPRRAALWTFLEHSFPSAVRALAGELFLATALFALGIAVSVALVRSDSTWFYAFVDAGLAQGRTPTASTADLRAALYDVERSGLSMFASFLFTHNAKIGMTAFALGIAAGFPTALLLFINGLMLGAFTALYADRGLLVPLLGWLLPHGVPEIGAMLLCGAAGLHLGRAMLLPGTSTVRDALSTAGRRASLVVAGTLILFFVAGVVEGVFRQRVTDDAARFVLAGFNATWLALWLLAAGRRPRVEVPP
jgi:uncharacterized membrane protein SpoIIM required for sporulation